MATINPVYTWATDGGAEVAEPPAGKKTLGWETSEKPPAGWFNWMQKTLCTKVNEIIAWTTSLQSGIIELKDALYYGSGGTNFQDVNTCLFRYQILNDALFCNFNLDLKPNSGVNVAYFALTGTALQTMLDIYFPSSSGHIYGASTAAVLEYASGMPSQNTIDIRLWNNWNGDFPLLLDKRLLQLNFSALGTKALKVNICFMLMLK